MTIMDTPNMKPGTIIHSTTGTNYVGESATRLFQVRAVIRALEFEHRTKLRVTRRGALPIAKKLTGLTTNDRTRLIYELEQLAERLAQNVQEQDNGPL